MARVIPAGLVHEGRILERAPIIDTQHFGSAEASVEALVEVVKRVAARRGATPAQIALAWVLAQGSDIVPIPGTKRVRYLEDNVGAVSVLLDANDLSDLNGIFANVAGARYNEQMQKLVEA